ncbi:MAG TPA: zinc ABC transporter substrate-binding protein [Pseudolabrys sp.]|nr:zinc ABC transporter substrate-binding protein [Pseudolabrys sp.]
MKTIVGAALGLLAGLLFGQAAPVRAAESRIAIVAAENFYGDIARQIGGDRVSVVSIMSNPSQDPHLFETTPSTVRQIAVAQIVILNGANYDTWMEKLLAAAPGNDRIVINAARTVGHNPGDNPHLWYDPATMPAVAAAVANALARSDGANAAEYSERLKTTLSSLEQITRRAEQLRAKHGGSPVTATEPVFGLMARALGLTMRNERFQLAMMNNIEPSARDVAAFESDLTGRKVKLLIYNSQVADPLTKRLRNIATKARIPVIGITETMPANVNFQDWIRGELDALDKALSGPNS